MTDRSLQLAFALQAAQKELRESRDTNTERKSGKVKDTRTLDASFPKYKFIVDLVK